MKKMCLSFIFTCAYCLSWAYTGHDYTKIDAHARATPATQTKSISKLAAHLTKPATNDYQKVRSFYVWISDNITYDVDLFRRYRPGSSLTIEPIDVIKKGKAVCQGYADLFNALCKEIGVESRLIPGYSKGFGNESRTDFSNADHAWNSVLIDDKWYLLDATWGAGGLNDKMQFRAHFNEKYFLASPAEFIKDHMPLQPMWQLLECPVSMKAFILGGEAIEQELSISKECYPYQKQIAEYNSMSEAVGRLSLAEEAYRFNPANHRVMARGYMDYAHHIMSGVKRQLSSREEIEKAVAAQEKALDYLLKAKATLSNVKDGAEADLDFVNKNIKNSEANIQSMKAVLQ